jgi:hypothetical protein
MEEIKVGMSTKEFIENLEVFNNTGEHIDNPKEGDYIRTIDGYIRKIAKVNTERKAITYSGTYILDKPYKNSQSVARNKIKKFSQDITELIEVGDYVNGYKVYDISTEYLVDINKEGKILYIEKEGFINATITEGEDDIKSIVTREQFENAEYKVEE